MLEATLSLVIPEAVARAGEAGVAVGMLRATGGRTIAAVHTVTSDELAVVIAAATKGVARVAQDRLASAEPAGAGGGLTVGTHGSGADGGSRTLGRLLGGAGSRTRSGGHGRSVGRGVRAGGHLGRGASCATDETVGAGTTRLPAVIPSQAGGEAHAGIVVPGASTRAQASATLSAGRAPGISTITTAAVVAPASDTLAMEGRDGVEPGGVMAGRGVGSQSLVALDGLISTAEPPAADVLRHDVGSIGAQRSSGLGGRGGSDDNGDRARGVLNRAAGSVAVSGVVADAFGGTDAGIGVPHAALTRNIIQAVTATVAVLRAFNFGAGAANVRAGGIFAVVSQSTTGISVVAGGGNAGTVTGNGVCTEQEESTHFGVGSIGASLGHGRLGQARN